MEKHFSWDGQTLSSDLIEWKLPSGNWDYEHQHPSSEMDLPGIKYKIHQITLMKDFSTPDVIMFHLVFNEYDSFTVSSPLYSRLDGYDNITTFDEWTAKYKSANGYDISVFSMTLIDPSVFLNWTTNIELFDSHFDLKASLTTNYKPTLDEIKAYTAGFKFKSSTTSTPTNPVTPTTPVTLESSMSSSEVSGMNGWYNSSWFGYYWKDSDTNWIYHYKLGWLYTQIVGDGSLWFYHAITDSWLWTSSEHFPLVYNKATTKSPSFISLQQWLHFDFNDDSVQAFDETDKEWYGKDYLKANYLEAYKEAEFTKDENGEIKLKDLNSPSTVSESSINSILDPLSPSQTFTTSSTTPIEMIWVEPGTFTMGSPINEIGRSSEEIQHQVTLSKGFYLGKYEVTQAQYDAVMRGNADGISSTTSHFSGFPNRPVESVYLIDISYFLDRLNDQQSINLPEGWAYTIPTQAQWEYACRAGTTTKYSWGDDINSSHANYNSAGYSRTRDVGQYAPNNWGFFDMHGNVEEWTADSHFLRKTQIQQPIVDPVGSVTDFVRFTRGGSWYDNISDLRSASVYSGTSDIAEFPFGHRGGMGFRVSLEYTGERIFELNETVDLKMIWVEPGTFTMGSPILGEYEHNVTLTKGFYLGEFEVTQAQYKAVMKGNSDGLNAMPSYFSYSPKRPVEKVSYDDIQTFLDLLNAQQVQNIDAGWSFVLPTEAQWEYACRAGTTTKYSWGDDINSSHANYNWDDEWESKYTTGVSIGETNWFNSNFHDYDPNPWGFFDMHGNVWEWTSDWYQDHNSSSIITTDPKGPVLGSKRVLRGGSWFSDGMSLSSAKRTSAFPEINSTDVGFRVSLQKK